MDGIAEIDANYPSKCVAERRTSAALEYGAAGPPMSLLSFGQRNADGSQDPSLPPLLDAMATELTAQRVGAATVMARLADIVITRLVRAWAESRSDETTGWLRYANERGFHVVFCSDLTAPTIRICSRLNWTQGFARVMDAEEIIGAVLTNP